MFNLVEKVYFVGSESKVFFIHKKVRSISMEMLFWMNSHVVRQVRYSASSPSDWVQPCKPHLYVLSSSNYATILTLHIIHLHERS